MRGLFRVYVSGSCSLWHRSSSVLSFPPRRTCAPFFPFTFCVLYLHLSPNPVSTLPCYKAATPRDAVLILPVQERAVWEAPHFLIWYSKSVVFPLCTTVSHSYLSFCLKRTTNSSLRFQYKSQDNNLEQISSDHDQMSLAGRGERVGPQVWCPWGGGTVPCDLSHDAFDVANPHSRGQTDAWENITFPQLCLQAVNIVAIQCAMIRFSYSNNLYTVKL